MKKTFRFIALIAGFAFLFAACESGTPKEPTGDDAGPIVCLGDSLTEGYGASRQGRVDKSKSYPAFLAAKVSSAVVNSGVSGDTAAGALARVERDVLAHEPGMVIILLGANDFFRMRPASETKGDLQSIIDKINETSGESGGSRKIYLASFIGDKSWETAILKEYPLLALTGFPALLSGYKKMYAELAAENANAALIPDIWTGVWNIHMSDPVHPDAEGYRIMADTIFNFIFAN